MRSARDQARQVRLGELSPLDLVEQSLRRIDALDGKVKAWVAVDRARALLTARQRYDGSRHGTVVGELVGVPVGIKDIIDVDGLPTRAGAPEFAHYTPQRAATVVERLRHEGAIVLGKTATTQFAYADPAPTRNPWDLEHTPGGSSSGSAAAVACGMVPIALGTQTLGSVLRPAAYCGIVGLKATHGRVSTAGVIPLAWNLDHVGILARSVTDAALVLGLIAGHDPADPRSAREPVPDMTPPASPPPPRIGVLRGYGDDRLSAEVRDHLDAVARMLAGEGAYLTDVETPVSVDDVRSFSDVILRYEAAQYHRPNFEKHAGSYGPAIRRLVEAGLATPPADYEAARARQPELRAALTRAMEGVDVLLLPVALTTAPKGLESTGDPAFCAPASAAGLPAIALPSGLGEGRLPLAVQLIGRAFAEPALLAAAAWVESRLAFDAQPPL